MIKRISDNLAARLRSFKFAFAGWISALRTEANFRIHTVAALVVIGAGWFFDISTTEWMAVCLAIGLVMAMELANAAIERLADIVQPNHDERIKVMKDLAAGAVLIAALAAAAVGMIIFLPKLQVFFGGSLNP